MALTNFKQQSNQIDETNHTLCRVAGCRNRWSVHMEGQMPMCSEHQWSDKKPATKRDIAVTEFTQPPVQHWQDDEVF
jgi:hypothetical protein